MTSELANRFTVVPFTKVRNTELRNTNFGNKGEGRWKDMSSIRGIPGLGSLPNTQGRCPARKWLHEFTSKELSLKLTFQGYLFTYSSSNGSLGKPIG